MISGVMLTYVLHAFKSEVGLVDYFISVSGLFHASMVLTFGVAYFQ